MAKSSKRKIEISGDADSLVFETGLSGLRAEQKMPVSEWADSFRVVSAMSSPEPGQWRTDRVPYAKEIMDALSVGSQYKKIVFMKGSQIGGTEIGLNWLGYIMDVAPGPVLYTVPNETFAKEYSRLRIDPMIEECERLTGKVREPKSRDGGNTTLRKEFIGGSLSMTGANSSANLRGKPIRFLFMDEVDEYPGDVGGQGDSAYQAEVRTRNFSRRKKIYAVSSPTIAGRSRIANMFRETDMRYFFVPCPSCGHMQKLVWAQVKWFDGNPKTAVYECEKCSHHIHDYEKQSLLANGEWRATAKCPRDVVGFHLSALYSPVGWFSWSDCVEMFLKAKDDRLVLKVFVNTILGEEFEERGDAPDWELLAARRESYARNVVPRGAHILTCGVDVQKDRLELEIVGWGKGKTTWSIDYRVLPGSPESGNTWALLDQILLEEIPCEEGGALPVRMLAIDSGAFTQFVYQWARQHPPGRVMAVKGMDSANQILMTPKMVDVDIRGKRIQAGVKLWGAGVSIAKLELYSLLRLRQNDDGTYPPGFCHFPFYDDTWFKGITAEQLMTRQKRSGAVTSDWVLPPGKRNEPLDCRILNRVAAAGLSLDRFSDLQWDRIAEESNARKSGKRDDKAQASAPPQKLSQQSRLTNFDGRTSSRHPLSGKGIRADWNDPD